MSKKLTIIKVLPNNGAPLTSEDLERWRKDFAEHKVSLPLAEATGQIKVEQLDLPEDENYITLVKVGDNSYQPSIEDLNAWREIFEQAKCDPDFRIFTYPGVEITTINVGKIIKVE